MRAFGLFVSGGLEGLEKCIVHVLVLLGQGNVNQLYLMRLWTCVSPPQEICSGRRRRCTRHLMPGILDRMACGVAIWGRAMCRQPPPGGKKTVLFFEECSMCIKHHKYHQKWPLGGATLGRGAGTQRAKHQEENCFFG